MPEVKETLGQKVRNELIKLNRLLLSGNYDRAEMARRSQALIANSFKDLNRTVAEYMKTEMPKAYAEGQAKANDTTPLELAVETDKLIPTIDFEQANKRATNFYIQISEQAKPIYQRIFKVINAEINKASTVTTVKELQSKIEERFRKEQIYKVPYANGRTMPLDAYAEVVARTGRTQVFNRGAIDYAQQRTDLVKCTTIFPTCEICIKFQGRVYSVSGKTKGYPALYETALKDGFEAIHPNCRHQFIPYFPEYQTSKERKENKEQSNKPFEDDRTEKNRKEYQDWQERNAKKRAKKNEKLKTEQSD